MSYSQEAGFNVLFPLSFWTFLSLDDTLEVSIKNRFTLLVTS